VEAEYKETVERLNREHANACRNGTEHAAEVNRLNTELATLLSATNSAMKPSDDLHADSGDN
jgi:hypothetical protein